MNDINVGQNDPNQNPMTLNGLEKWLMGSESMSPLEAAEALPLEQAKDDKEHKKAGPKQVGGCGGSVNMTNVIREGKSRKGRATFSSFLTDQYFAIWCIRYPQLIASGPWQPYELKEFKRILKAFKYKGADPELQLEARYHNASKVSILSSMMRSKKMRFHKMCVWKHEKPKGKHGWTVVENANTRKCRLKCDSTIKNSKDVIVGKHQWELYTQRGTKHESTKTAAFALRKVFIAFFNEFRLLN